MKLVWIVCSRCAGSGQIKRYVPHISEPNIVTCPQCRPGGALAPATWHDGLTMIQVFAPDASDLCTAPQANL